MTDTDRRGANHETRVIDKSDVGGNWTRVLDNGAVDRQLNNGDLLILKDPQERLGPDTYSVGQIVPDKHDRIKQLGLFWEKEEAIKFAHNRKFPLANKHTDADSHADEVTR